MSRVNCLTSVRQRGPTLLDPYEESSKIQYIETPRGATHALLIFDELALFEWIGHSAMDVSRFFRKGECEQSNHLSPIYTNPNSRLTFS
jgi:hypothetical protein